MICRSDFMVRVGRYDYPTPCLNAYEIRELCSKVKSAVTVRDAIAMYCDAEHQLDRNGMMCCPFPDHAERTPSFKVYDEAARGFCCFGCHRGGDVITFVRLLFELDNNLQAVKKLNEDFRLGLSFVPAGVANFRASCDRVAKAVREQRRIDADAAKKRQEAANQRLMVSAMKDYVRKRVKVDQKVFAMFIEFADDLLSYAPNDRLEILQCNSRKMLKLIEEDPDGYYKDEQNRAFRRKIEGILRSYGKL